MRKFRYVVYAIAFIVGIIIAINQYSNRNLNLTYETVNHFGVSFEVPQNYQSSYLSTGNQYMYATKNENFVISIIREDGTDEVPLLDVVRYYKEYLENGSVQLVGGKASWSSSTVSNVRVPVAVTTYLNGLEVGHIVQYYDYKPKNTMISARQQTYVISKGNDLISVIFISSAKDYEDYRGIIDHITNSINVTN